MDILEESLVFLGCGRCSSGHFLDENECPCKKAYTTEAKHCGTNYILGSRELRDLEGYFESKNKEEN